MQDVYKLVVQARSETINGVGVGILKGIADEIKCSRNSNCSYRHDVYPHIGVAPAAMTSNLPLVYSYHLDVVPHINIVLLLRRDVCLVLV